MEKLLYVGPNVTTVYTGGGQGNQHRIEIFEEIFGKKNVCRYYIDVPSSKFNILLRNIFLYPSELSFFDEAKIINLIITQNITTVFLSRSLLGRLAKIIKKRCPKVKIITWFQNVEYFFSDETSYQNFIYKKLMTLVSKVNEKQTLIYSDVRIALNNRDSQLIRKVYSLSVDKVIPIAFKDIYDSSIAEKVILNANILFVGSDFKPNVEGIIWFINKVMPFVNAKLQVVGFGMEKYREELERHNVEIIGKVNDLSNYYYNASIVVAPIFKGAGMKTKVAEALMFGKTVFGTTEGLQGYDQVPNAIEECNSAECFINKINSFTPKINNFNIESRKVYIENHTYSAVKQSLMIELKSKGII